MSTIEQLDCCPADGCHALADHTVHVVAATMTATRGPMCERHALVEQHYTEQRHAHSRAVITTRKAV
jgi:hypothetical protein